MQFLRGSALSSHDSSEHRALEAGSNSTVFGIMDGEWQPPHELEPAGAPPRVRARSGAHAAHFKLRILHAECVLHDEFATCMHLACCMVQVNVACWTVYCCATHTVQHATCSMQHITCTMQRTPPCDVHHEACMYEACTTQHAMTIQRTPCKLQHATCRTLHATCNIPDTCNAHDTPCSAQHATSNACVRA